MTAQTAGAQSWPVHRFELSNGIKVILVEDHSLGIFELSVVLRQGSVVDPPGKEGLARLTARAMLRGSVSRSREQIEEEVEYLGSDLAAEAGWDGIIFSASGLVRNFDKLLDVLGEVVSRPGFPQEEVDKLIRETTAEIRELWDNDRHLANVHFRRALLQGHPHGHLSTGTTVSVGAITRDDLLDFYRSRFTGPNLMVAASGALDAKLLRPRLEQALGGLASTPAPDGAVPEPAMPRGRRVVLVDKPHRTQTQIVLGHLGIRAMHPDRFPLMLVNTTFGGTFTARLMQEIRVKRGWSYGAYSSLQSSRDLGTFKIWTFPAVQDTLPTLRLALELLEDLAHKGIDEQELDFARTYHENAFAFSVDTAEKMAQQYQQMELYGLPDDYLATYRQKVKDVTLEQARRAAAELLHPHDLVVSVLCTADVLEEEVKKLPNVVDVEVLPYTHERKAQSAERGKGKR